MGVLFFLTIFTFPPILYAQNSLTLGIHPFLPALELIDRFMPLANYLSRETGFSVSIKVTKSYEDHIEEIGNDLLDVAYMGPASYIKMVQKYGQKPLLAQQKHAGIPKFHGVIFTAKNSQINSLVNLKGKRFAFGSTSSTMSYLIPRFMLLKSGIRIEDFEHFDFLENHNNVALSVLMGDFDAGATKEEVFQLYEKRGLKLLAKSPPITEHLFVARKSLSQQVILALRSSLFKLSKFKEGKQILSSLNPSLSGMVPVTDSDYNSLREIVISLKQQGIEL